MTFATAGNFNAVSSTYSDNTDSRLALAQIVTFPDISGRDAPGKTGSAAKPALVSEIGLRVSSGSGATDAQLALWSSTGTDRAASASFTLQSTTTPPLETRAISDRLVFGLTNYYVGFVKGTLNRTYRWSVSSSNLKTRFSNTQPNFTNSPQAGPDGTIIWRLSYDVLPTAPLSPTGSASGADINLSWSAPSSDGGRAITGYRIQRSTDGVSFTTLVDNTNSTSTTYTDSNLTPGRTYTYRVAAINAVAIAAGSDYSGPYATTTGLFVEGIAGNLTSLLTATVDNPQPEPLNFSDFGDGIRFTKIDVQYGSEFLYNEVEASTQDSFAEVQTIDAPVSKRLYGVRTYTITNLLNSTDEGALEVAEDYLISYFEPQLRINSITVDLNNLTTEEKLQVLGLEIDSFIRVSFTPNGIGEPKISQGLLTGIAHRISITTHEVELRLRNRNGSLFILDSDLKGILDVNTLN